MGVERRMAFIRDTLVPWKAARNSTVAVPLESALAVRASAFCMVAQHAYRIRSGWMLM